MEIARQTGYDEKNAELLLLALSSCGSIRKQENRYSNTEEGRMYLSRRSPYYLGETILFREAMTSLHDIGNSVSHGVCEEGGHTYDFARLAEVTVTEMYATGRIKSFLVEIAKTFPNPASPLKMLDLGGGSGILAIEFSKKYPQSNSCVFEHPSVADTTKRIIAYHHAGHRVSVLSGDFNTDDIGGGYDLIVASGILDFTTGSLGGFFEKIAAALTDNGYLLLIGRFSETEGYPQENMISWLSGYMNGIKPPPAKQHVEAGLKVSGLQEVRSVQSGRFEGCLYRKVV